MQLIFDTVIFEVSCKLCLEVGVRLIGFSVEKFLSIMNCGEKLKVGFLVSFCSEFLCSFAG